MVLDSNEYTLTMAQVYAAQGHWKKAVEIYRHLVRVQPERADLREALKTAEQRLEAAGARRLDDLAPLLQTWLKLQTRLNQLQKLKKLKG